jgi:hypothetical protein
VAFFISYLASNNHNQTPIEELAQRLTKNAKGELEMIERLCKFVHCEIYPFPLDRWLSPVDVLRFRIGDCKNKAVLLQSLLQKKGIQSEIVVGLVGWRSPPPKVHAWVSIVSNGYILICDPVITHNVLTPEEYDVIVYGFVNVTKEYRMKVEKPSATSSINPICGIKKV